MLSQVSSLTATSSNKINELRLFFCSVYTLNRAFRGNRVSSQDLSDAIAMLEAQANFSQQMLLRRHAARALAYFYSHLPKPKQKHPAVRSDPL